LVPEEIDGCRFPNRKRISMFPFPGWMDQGGSSICSESVRNPLNSAVNWSHFPELNGEPTLSFCKGFLKIAQTGQETQSRDWDYSHLVAPLCSNTDSESDLCSEVLFGVSQIFALAPRPTLLGKRSIARCQIVARAFPLPSADQATALKAGRLIPLGARGLEGARPLGQILRAGGRHPVQVGHLGRPGIEAGARSLLQGAQRPPFTPTQEIPHG
jgi:hypothetical protein